MVELSGTHGDHIVSIEALGVGIDISVAGPACDLAHDRIQAAWAGALRTKAEAEDVVRVCAGAESHSADLSSDDLDVLLHHLSQIVTLRAIEARAGDLMMLHAAGLANPVTGATVALVAPSGTGKTTLCRSLGTEFGYVSDETVGFDRTLSVAPYRKPLSVVAEGHPIKHQFSPIELGLRAVPPSPHLVAVLLLERSEQVSGLEIEEMRTVAALPTLAEHVSYLDRHEHPLGFLAGALEETGGLRRVRYSAASDLRPLVHELTGGGS